MDAVWCVQCNIFDGFFGGDWFTLHVGHCFNTSLPYYLGSSSELLYLLSGHFSLFSSVLTWWVRFFASDFSFCERLWIVILSGFMKCTLGFTAVSVSWICSNRPCRSLVFFNFGNKTTLDLLYIPGLMSSVHLVLLINWWQYYLATLYVTYTMLIAVTSISISFWIHSLLYGRTLVFSGLNTLTEWPSYNSNYSQGLSKTRLS